MNIDKSKMGIFVQVNLKYVGTILNISMLTFILLTVII